MNEIANLAIKAVKSSEHAFCKFISANDAGATGAHQEGFYMPKSTWPLMFESPGVKGELKDNWVKITWQDDFTTDSRFIYYGKGTRNEYRLTRFGKGFPFLEEDNVGDLMILCKFQDLYKGYVLRNDEDIDGFFAEFNLSSAHTNKLIEKDETISPIQRMESLFDAFLNQHNDFPSTELMSGFSRESYLNTFKISRSHIVENPDSNLLKWIDTEYHLFRLMEGKLYGDILARTFESVEQMVEISNSVLNRRKSRAGKSLEHHLSYIFNQAELRFESQVITEENKKPDFIFPGSKEYHDFLFPGDKLVCLGAKTTCKDRWRQVINEADRVPVKHLFTLQQGISKNQLTEMYNNNVCLVVPAPYKDKFDSSFQDRILTLGQFNKMVLVKQG